MSDDRICERCSGTRIVDSRACPNCGVVLPAPPGERPKPLGDKPGTHVFGHFYVTNSSAGNVVILKARLRKYATEYAHVLTRHPEKNVFGRNAILSYRISAVIADFSFFPPIARGRETLTSDVIFTDNFGDEHRRALSFESRNLMLLFGNSCLSCKPAVSAFTEHSIFPAV